MKSRTPHRPPDPWALLTWLLVIAVLTVLLTADAIAPDPAADVEPVVHAHWYQIDEDILCSNCGKGYTGGETIQEAKEHLDSGETYNRYPHCRAKMDGEVAP